MSQMPLQKDSRGGNNFYYGSSYSNLSSAGARSVRNGFSSSWAHSIRLGELYKCLSWVNIVRLQLSKIHTWSRENEILLPFFSFLVAEVKRHRAGTQLATFQNHHLL